MTNASTKIGPKKELVGLTPQETHELISGVLFEPGPSHHLFYKLLSFAEAAQKQIESRNSIIKDLEDGHIKMEKMLDSIFNSEDASEAMRDLKAGNDSSQTSY